MPNWGEMPPNSGEREMRIKKPWYLAAQPILGFEDPDPNIQPDPVDDPGIEGDPVQDEPKSYSEDDVAGLKSALAAERKAAKANAAKLKAFEKAQQDKADAEKTEIQRLTDQGTSAAEKLQKLADGFRKTRVEAAVIEAAKKAKFLDPTDAIRPDVMSAIGVEQDEDDPTRVTIDEATVIEAVKTLAKSKPHWVASDKQTPPPSGSKFGGNNNPQKLTPDQQLMAQYPALARRG